MASCVGSLTAEPIAHRFIEIPFSEKEDLLAKLELVMPASDGKALLDAICRQNVNSKEAEIAFEFARDLESLLTLSKEKLSDREIAILFDILMGLLSCKGYESKNIQGLTFYFLSCMELTSAYNFRSNKTPLQLPLYLHLKALDLCKSLLMNHNDPQVVQNVLKTLPHTIDHIDFPQEDQWKVLTFIKQFSKTDKDSVEAYYRCATLEHIYWYVRHVASDIFLMYETRHFVQFKFSECNASPLETRRLVINYLPFPPRFSSVRDDIRNIALGIMIRISEDISENKDMRKLAVSQLSGWVWMQEKGESVLTQNQERAIDVLFKLIARDSVNSLVSTICDTLFNYVNHSKDSNPTAKYVVEKFKELINHPHILLSKKIKAAGSMPKILISGNRIGLDVFFFMYEKLTDESHPIELKRIYAEHLVWGYFFSEVWPQIEERDPSISTLNKFLHHKVFKNKELRLISRKACGEMEEYRKHE